MRVSTTKRQLGLGLFLVSGLVWATACGRTTIDFGVPEGNGGVGGTVASGGVGAEGGFGGDAGFGGSGAEGGTAGQGAQGGVGAEGGFGGDAGFGGSGAAGSGGAGDDCLAVAADDCDVCTCDGCRAEWDACQDDMGCIAIVDCAKAAGCSGAQCLGPCGQVIQQNGGVQGQPAQLALGLGTCQSTTCGSDCNGSGGNGGNGGTGGSGGGGGIVDCISCVGQNCPQAQECLLDQACRDGAICAFTQCLGGGGGGGGGLDFQCLLGCFNGDFNAALQAFNSVQCVFTSCGSDCGGLLGGGGGGTPFGGGGGGTPFGGFGGGN
ncbi:MAG: hypothetical protein AB7S68_16010 [Polyangiaceae bacterium]